MPVLNLVRALAAHPINVVIEAVLSPVVAARWTFVDASQMTGLGRALPPSLNWVEHTPKHASARLPGHSCPGWYSN